MPWIQLKLNTTGANAEDLSDALMEAGAVSITFQDTHDTPVFEPLPGETRLWGDTDVIGLFDAETDMNDVVAILENHPVLATLNIQYLGFHPIVPSLLLSLLAFLVGNRFGTSVPQATVLTTDK